MAAITICSDFGAQEVKSATIATVSPSICHEVLGLDAMISVISYYNKPKECLKVVKHLPDPLPQFTFYGDRVRANNRKILPDSPP